MLQDDLQILSCFDQTVAVRRHPERWTQQELAVLLVIFADAGVRP